MESNKKFFIITIGLALLAVAALVPFSFFWFTADPIPVSVLYSTEKEAWLAEVTDDFAGEVNGRPIELQLKKMGSREMVLSVLDGTEQPVLFSPASSLQISLLQEQSRDKFGTPLVDPADRARCRSVARTPLVLVAWRERAEALWGDTPAGNMWPQLHQALVEKGDWSHYNHPEWGYIKFGHTDPLTSNSGLMTILLLTYDYFGRTSGLTSEEILTNEAFRDWFTAMERTISDFGNSTGTYMRDIVVYGPSRYDLVAVYEATAIEQADNAAGRYGELRVYYPPATVLSDHPFCLLQADWVASEQARAAQLFMDYLVSRPVQEKALEYGFRPTESTIDLGQPDSPFIRYADNGLRLDLPPEVEVPPGDVLDTLLDFWARNVRR